MNKSLFYILVAGLGLGGCRSLPQPAAVKEVPQSANLSLSYGDILDSTLPNGMRVVIKPMPTSSLVTVQVWVRTGSVDEGEQQGTGISHFVEHMLFKGTTRHKVGEISAKIAAIGGDSNAYTSFDRTVYHVTAPAESFETVLDLQADAIMHSTFDSTEYAREQQVILKEINMNQDNHGRYFSRLLWQTAYDVHPYRYPVIGYRKLLAAVTRDELVAYYRARYQPNNMFVVIAGRVDPQAAYRKVKQSFAEFERGSLASSYVAPEPTQMAAKERVLYRDVTTTTLTVAFHGPDIRSPDLYPMDVIASVIGQGSSSRLSQRLVHEENLCLSIHAWSHTPSDPGLFGISAVVRKYEDVERVKEVIAEELLKIKTTTISAKELEIVKSGVLSEMIFNLQSVTGQAGDLGGNLMATGDVGFSQTYLDGIGAVYPQQIKDLARKYFVLANRTTMVLAPERHRPEAISDSDNPAVARAKFSEHRLDNQTRVLIQENAALPIVSLRVVFLGGLVYDPVERAGLTNMLSGMLLAGTKTRNRQQIAELLKERGGSIATYTGRNSFGISVDVLRPDLPLALDLLADVMQNATFPEAELEKTRARLLTTIASKDDKSFSLGGKLLRQQMFAGHPYQNLREGSAESVQAISRDELVAYYRQMLQPQNTVISVAGQVDRVSVLAELNRRLGPQVAAKPIPVPKNAPVQFVHSATEEVKAGQQECLILIGYPGISVQSEDRYKMELLSTILSGQSGRLYQALREREGLCYYVGAYNFIGLDPGAMIFYIGTGTDKKEQALSGLKREIRAIAEAGVSASELEIAKAQLLGDHIKGQEQNGNRAFSAALNVTYGLGLSASRLYPERIKAITAAQISAAARRYLGHENFTEVIITGKE